MGLFFRALSAVAIGGLISSTQAQTYPSKLITIVAPYAAGGSIDLVARVVGKGLAERLGQTVIVKNIPGAGGTVGTRVAAKAEPDGHTLLLASTGPMAIGPSVHKNLGFDAVHDFTPISTLVTQPMYFCVEAGSPIKSIKDVIDIGKATNKRPTAGTPGIGSTTHLALELFNMLANTTFVHVPYKGTAPLTIGILSNQVTMGVTSAIDALPQVKAGKIRALASSSAQRSKLLPDVPTVAESGVPGFDMEVWYGLMAPAETPKLIIDRLNAEVTKILAQPEVAAALEQLGAIPAVSTPEQFEKRLVADIAKYAPLVERSGAKEK